MQNKKNYKDTDKIYSDFINERKKLSETDKVIEAGALIEDIKSVDVDEAFQSVKDKIDRKQSFFDNKIITWITRVAAILVIPLLVYNIWNFTLSDSEPELAENEFTIQEISSPIGMKTHVVLPDGTDMWLNAGSKISYKIPFVGKVRKVKLTGEAFLKVKKNPDSPFLLCAGIAHVKVLGTQFNVKAYPEDDNVEVALIEGSVRFSFNKQGKKVYTKLKPNEILTLDKNSKRVFVKKEKLFKYTAWSQNILVFDETPITEVAKTLERWYGVKVVIKDEEIKKYKFNTVFENEPLSRVLELLELTSPISIKYKNGKLNKKTHKLDQSIVTISKK